MSFFPRRLRMSSSSISGAGSRDKSTRAKKRGMPAASSILMVFGGLITALLLGMVIALGAIQLTILLTGILVFIPILFVVSTKRLLPIMFVAIFFVAGTAQYFFSLRLATWLASGLSALFFARAILELTLSQGRSHMPLGENPVGASRIIIAVWIYLLFYAFSIFLGHASTVQLISVLRFCIPMFGLLFAMYWFHWSCRRLLVLWTLIVLIALAQLPLVVYQHFFKISTLGWDGVVGSFGGNMSPVLVLFVVSAMLYMLARWIRGITPLWQLIVVFIIGLAVILLGEVKAVFLWLPIGVFWVARSKVMKNLASFIIFAAMMTAISSGIFMAYHAMYWGDHTKTDTMEEKVTSVGGYVVDPNGINYVTGEMSRAATLVLWYNDPMPTIQERLIGYGPGASLTSQSTGRGVVAARYRNLQIGSTGLAVLLWDVGILGTMAFLSIFVGGIILGIRYVSRSKAGPEQMAMADTSVIVLALYLSTLVYNKTMIDEPSAQLLCYFCLGCIIQFARYAPAAPVTTSTGDAQQETMILQRGMSAQR